MFLKIPTDNETRKQNPTSYGQTEADEEYSSSSTPESDSESEGELRADEEPDAPRNVRTLLIVIVTVGSLLAAAIGGIIAVVIYFRSRQKVITLLPQPKKTMRLAPVTVLNGCPLPLLVPSG